MAKKLKALAGGLSENQLAQTVRDSAQQIWLAGLGAFAKAQAEGGKVFDALVKEGERLQSRTREAADDRIAAVAGKAAGTWDRLESVFEERVARALGSLGVPTKKDVERLTKRVAELSALVQELTEASAAAAAAPAPAPARKPAARKPAAPKAAPAQAGGDEAAAAPAKKAPARKPAVRKAAAKPAAAEPAGAEGGTATLEAILAPKS